MEDSFEDFAMMFKKKTDFFHPLKPSAEDYSVYVFFRHGLKDSDGQDLSYQWEKIRQTGHKTFALKKAERLYQSNQYEKVVVKYRYVDRKSGQSQGRTFMVFGGDRGWMVFIRRHALLLKILGSSAALIGMLGFLRV